MKIYVVVGAYPHEAGCHLLRAYSNKEQAEEGLQMIQEVDQFGKAWEIKEVEFVKPYPALK